MDTDNCIALRSDDAHFVALDDAFLVDDEKLKSWGYNAKINKQLRIVLDSEKTSQLLEYLKSKPNHVEDYVKETKRLEPHEENEELQEDDIPVADAAALEPADTQGPEQPNAPEIEATTAGPEQPDASSLQQAEASGLQQADVSGPEKADVTGLQQVVIAPGPEQADALAPEQANAPDSEQTETSAPKQENVQGPEQVDNSNRVSNR